jgi:hypothetical protein
MLRRFVLIVPVLALVAASAVAQPAPKPAPAAPKAMTAMPATDDQTPPPPPPSPRAPRAPATPAPPPSPPPPQRKGQPINVRVEVVITDQRGNVAPIKKTVSLIVGDQQNGMIRSEAFVPGAGGAVPLHVDASPELLQDGKIRLRLNLAYDLPRAEQAGERDPFKMSIRENLSFIIENGKPMLVTQSADPVGDRQVVVEVKATVLK